MRNRSQAMRSGKTTSRPSWIVQDWATYFDELEQRMEVDIKRIVENVPIYHEMMVIPGIATLPAARLLAYVDITRSTTVSKLWRFCGYGVRNGTAERVPPWKMTQRRRALKSSCYMLGSNLIQESVPYREIFDDAYLYYRQQHEEWTEDHVRLAAHRKVVKVFLAHFWERYRSLSGLEVKPLYVHEYLGHYDILHPEKFGWPNKNSTEPSPFVRPASYPASPTLASGYPAPKTLENKYPAPKAPEGRYVTPPVSQEKRKRQRRG